MESSLPSSAVRLTRRVGYGATLLLLIVLVFQESVLTDTLGIKGAGRVFNAVALAAFTLSALYAIVSGRVRKAPMAYVVPVVLVVAGIAINLGRSFSPESLGAAGAILAWVAALSVPFMKSFDLERAWRIFYRFMVWGSAVAVLEYMAIFAGLLPLTSIETDRGPFLKGIFTIFFGLEDNSAYYRMYGLFAEPGTYAMFLLPAIAYAALHGRRWSVALFLGCLYFTDSLGGIAGVIVMGGAYLVWRSSKRPVGLAIAFLVTGIIAYSASGSLRERYEEKGASASIREDNVTLFRDNFVPIVTANPFGLPLTGHSLSELQDVSANYIGSNFEVYTLFVKGGILACLGYSMLVIWVVVRTGRYVLSGDRDPTRAAAVLSLPAILLFIFQRDTVLSSALFAFLFVEPLMATPRPGLRAADTLHREHEPSSLAVPASDEFVAPGQ